MSACIVAARWWMFPRATRSPALVRCLTPTAHLSRRVRTLVLSRRLPPPRRPRHPHVDRRAEQSCSFADPGVLGCTVVVPAPDEGVEVRRAASHTPAWTLCREPSKTTFFKEGPAENRGERVQVGFPMRFSGPCKRPANVVPAPNPRLRPLRPCVCHPKRPYASSSRAHGSGTGEMYASSPTAAAREREAAPSLDVAVDAKLWLVGGRR